MSAERSAEPPTCEPWCGTKWDSHGHDSGLVFQDMATPVLRTRCYCTLACRDAGRPLHPASPPATPPALEALKIRCVVDPGRLAESIRKTVAINRGQSAEVLARGVLACLDTLPSPPPTTPPIETPPE